MPIPDFIVSLRRKIGHDELWMERVVGICLGVGVSTRVVDHPGSCLSTQGDDG